MLIKHMKNKPFFSKFLATPELFVYEEKVIARVLEDRFRVLDQPVHTAIHTGGSYMAKKPKKTKG
jgi:hypothetical protein